VGWGFTPRFTLLAGLAGAEMEDDPDEFALVHLDLLARFNFRSGHAFVPFLEGGFSVRAAAQDDVEIGNGSPQTGDLEISGGAFTVGGGAHYFVTPSVAFTASLQISSGEFSTVKFDNVSIDGFEIDATSARLNLGVTMYPMRQRQ
jgi:opacity protein-like surface antigen